MTGERLASFLTQIGEQKLIEAEEYTKTQIPKIKKKKMIALIAAAAALLIAAGAATAVIALRAAGNGAPPDAEIRADSRRAPAVLFPGLPDASGDSCPLPSGFYIGAVFEGEIEEILEGSYQTPGEQARYTVLRLKVGDVLYGKGLPESLFLRCADCPREAFEGYDRFLFSLRQTGINNFALAEEKTGRIVRFENMFDCFGPVGSPQISVLAFKNGVFAPDFYDRANAGKKEWIRTERKSAVEFLLGYGEGLSLKNGATAAQVKETIRALIQNTEGQKAKRYGSSSEPVYLDESSFFGSSEEVRWEVSPERGVFVHRLIDCGEGVTGVDYTRLINGCKSEERITVLTTGEVKRSGAHFTDEELERLPDVRPIIEAFDGSAVRSPSADAVKDVSTLESWNASGYYFKREGEISAIVFYHWYYRFGDPEYRYSEVGLDRLYVLYDARGKGKEVNADELYRLTGVTFMPAGGYTMLLSPTDVFDPNGAKETTPVPPDERSPAEERTEEKETAAEP